MNQTQRKNAVRKEIFDYIIPLLREHFVTDVEFVNSGTVMMPMVDPEKHECFAKIAITIPNGTRNGNGSFDAYDGYAEAEAYRIDLEEDAAKKAANEEKKRREKEEKERKRAARKTIKKLNEEGLDKMIHEGE